MKKIKFNISKATLLEDSNDSQFATAEIEAFSTGENLHDLTCSLAVLKETSSTIYEKPVIFVWNGWKDDFGGHSDRSIIAGFVVGDSAEFIERDDGRITLKVKAKIWKYYAPGFVKKFEDSDDNNKSVSVEMELFETSDEKDGYSEMISFAYTAVTVLGDDVDPASPDASITMVSFSDVRNKIKEDYLREFGAYSDIDFSIPNNIKNTATRGLERLSESDVSVHVVAEAMGKHLSSSEDTNKKKVVQMEKFFRNFSAEDGDEKKEILWLLYGGKDGNEWAIELNEKIVAEDNKITAHFETISDDAISGFGGREEDTVAKKKEKEISSADEDEEVVDPEVTDFAEEESEEDEDEQVTMGDDESEDEEFEDEESEDESDEEDSKDDSDMAKPEEDEEVDMGLKFALAASEIDNRINKALSSYTYMEKYGDKEYEMGAYWVVTHDEKYAYVHCYESNKIYRMGYSIVGETVKVSLSKDEEVYITSSYILASDAIQIEEEYEALKAFKADIDEKTFNFEVNSTLNLDGVKENLSEEDRKTFIEKAKDFTIETIDGWKNELKAFAFDVALRNPKTDEEDDTPSDGTLRMDVINKSDAEEGNGSLWD